MIAPMIRVDIPHDVWCTYWSLLSLSVYWIPNAFANPSPKLWLVPDCNAFPSCINASIVYVACAPANFSFSVFCPLTTGIARYCSQKSAYIFNICTVLASASSAVACAVCPSCQKNSEVLKNGLVVFSQRTTETH